MQAVLEEVEVVVRSFLTSDYRIMIILCGVDASVLFTKILSRVEEDPLVPEIFLCFGHGFKVPGEYVDSIVSQIEAQTVALNSQLEARGEALLPEPPAFVRDSAERPDDRLWELIRFLRVAVPEERPLLCMLYPLEDLIAEGPFSVLIESLISRLDDAQLEGVKLIVRDTESGLLSRKYNDWPGATIYKPPLDKDSLFGRMVDQADSPQATPEERSQAQMLAAGVDIANKRFDKALGRNQSVLDYFTRTGQRQRQSIVLSNMGDVYYLQQQFPEAQQHYEQAIEIAVAEESQPLVIYQSINLGNSLLMQGKYDDAVTYYQAAEQLAAANNVLPHQIRALEMAGAARREQGLVEEAIAIWERGADLCRQSGYKLGLAALLERLKEAHAEIGADHRHAAVRRELEECKADLSEINPALANPTAAG